MAARPLTCAGVAALALAVTFSAQTADPLAFLGQVRLTDAERTRVDRGEALVKNLPARDANVSVLAVARTGATADRLIAWIREIARLKAGPQVRSIARFSNPPRLEDLASLTLDEEDLRDIRRCRPGDCSVRLSEAEITALKAAADTAGNDNSGNAWMRAVQETYRRAMLSRAETYLRSGHQGTPPFRDQGTPVDPAREAEEILKVNAILPARAPALVEHLRRFPHASHPEIESFLYWSKEELGRKPIVAITHVNILHRRDPEGPEALVVSKQVYASHYMTGSLAMTAITTTDPTGRYLVYLNQSRLDVFGGIFGGIVRRVVDGRLRGEADEVVHAVRKRLESGPP